ncbi:MAG: hypothetical protein MRY64_11985 [Hyphomonadaceae bacterium]|nr:hypothetical protein [Hyphomonadaceae bacterium]
MQKNENKKLGNAADDVVIDMMNVRQVTDAWRICQDQINRTQREQDDLFVRDGDNIDALYELESRRGALKKRADELVHQLISLESASTNDVAAKLSLWRDVNCPPDTPLNRKTAIDFVVVSALRDLQKLAS